MSSVPDVRSLGNALDLLRYMNEEGIVSPRALKSHLKITNGSVYRLLTTLLSEGYIQRGAGKGTYEPARKLLSLSYGYDAETWPEEVAAPILKELSARIEWPAAIGAIEGPSVHVLATSDESSHYVLRQLRAGRRVPLFKSAIGWVSLAAYPVKLQAAIWSALASGRASEKTQLPSEAARDRILALIASRGYHCVGDNRTRQIVLAVPIVAKARVLGGLSIRVFVAGSSEDEVVRRNYRIVQSAAQKIALGYDHWLSRP